MLKANKNHLRSNKKSIERTKKPNVFVYSETMEKVSYHNFVENNYCMKIEQGFGLQLK